MRQLKITKQVTNRETASLDKYLQEIGKVDLITAEEEVELAQRIKAGDQNCFRKIDQSQPAFCGFCCQTISESRTNVTGFNQ